VARQEPRGGGGLQQSTSIQLGGSRTAGCWVGSRRHHRSHHHSAEAEGGRSSPAEAHAGEADSPRPCNAADQEDPAVARAP
ncbi:unnamed protein product, partial [Effrenium voratum]